MTDPREPYALIALEALYSWAAEQPFGSAPWLHDWVDLPPPHQEALMRAASAVARVAVRGERERCEARLAEVREAAVTFKAVRAGVLHPEADALWHAVVQVIDKVPLAAELDSQIPFPGTEPG